MTQEVPQNPILGAEPNVHDVDPVEVPDPLDTSQALPEPVETFAPSPDVPAVPDPAPAEPVEPGVAAFAAGTPAVEPPEEAVFVPPVPVDPSNGEQVVTSPSAPASPTVTDVSASNTVTGDVETLIREIHSDVKQLLAGLNQLGSAVGPIVESVQKEGLSGLVKALLKSI